MNLRIRHVCDENVCGLVDLAQLAWAPVFRSFEETLGSSIHPLIWPDWSACQREAVEMVYREQEKTTAMVAELGGKAVGLMAYELHAQDGVGDVVLLAVHPDHQNRAIGTELNNAALDRVKAGGMKMARVETGGGPSHAPDRRC